MFSGDLLRLVNLILLSKWVAKFIPLNSIGLFEQMYHCILLSLGVTISESQEGSRFLKKALFFSAKNIVNASY